MATGILFTGVGGQGTILTTRLLSNALAELGYDVKMSEIHGMAQRGGTVNTQLRYGERVYAPNIGEGEADFVVAFEKAEALRALPYLKRGGTVLTDEREIYSMPVLLGQAAYPHNWIADNREYNVTVIPAQEIAGKLGNARDANIVMLGAVAKLLKIEINIPARFSVKAYEAGKEAV
ncbi:MAG: indolepyruvate oxidoreductase subunit beta [Oscillospiraceae bacterium]|jgi:indolepyruvate ferredoxin oxidoreductase beta subunit|nr:indolepyruvate oxidoreductase subunit beta [Oscillospiraceae bacterium]